MDAIEKVQRRATSLIPGLVRLSYEEQLKETGLYILEKRLCTLPTARLWDRKEEEEIGTILCAERWCCLSSLLGYGAQSWTGRHPDTVYQHAGTHFADLGRMRG